MSTVTLKIENTYVCGRESEFEKTAPAPTTIGPADEYGQLDLGDWWDEHVHDLTGDGHPCGASEDAMYEATIIAADDPALVGQKMEWGL